MPALASDLRKTLEATVVKARDTAEGGARDALTALAVGASEPFGSMSEEERKLRNRLRARGRQLGDQAGPTKGTQSIERLVREMAYEHWHRMLFARFLAENQLLIEPSSGVSITLDECEELAAEEGTDLWGLAAQYAQSMLPQIFRGDDPVLAAKLPLEIRQQLQGLVAGLEIETFTASDSLGWTYQFWQTKRKKEVNDSGVKIGADEISPVTQLFTEDYMVDFLLDNTLGAWHAGKVLASNPQLASSAQTEVDLRQAVALPGCPWSYLRFIKTDDGLWAPAAGTFEAWPGTAAELKCLDPCMGSGHFVVAMFERLVELRLAEENIDEAAAVAAVIQDNLFGLEIDPRCTQIAAFNLALAAWRRLGHRKLPMMNLACSGLSPNASESEWLALASDNERLRNGMARLYWLFDKAAVLGSLINPRADEADLLVASFQELRPLLEQAMAKEAKDDNSHELAVTAQGLAKAAGMISSKFSLIVTNVPYLARGKQSDFLREYCDINHGEARADLATCFIERCFQFSSEGGSCGLVSPQSWLFLGAHKNLRKGLLQNFSWNSLATLGAGAFQTISGEVVNTVLSIASKIVPTKGQRISSVTATQVESAIEKVNALRNDLLLPLSQHEQTRNPDCRIIIGERSDLPLLSELAVVSSGMLTGDIAQYTRYFWEQDQIEPAWEFLQSSVSSNCFYGGRQQVVLWEKGCGRLYRYAESVKHLNTATQRWRTGQEAWGRRGVVVSCMGSLECTLYTGDRFDNNVGVIVPRNENDLPAIWMFCSSEEFSRHLRLIDRSIKVTPSTFVKVPVDIEQWRAVAAEHLPNGLPKIWSSKLDQWVFDGIAPNSQYPLHVATAKLLGYQWPSEAQGGSDILKSSDKDGIVCLNSLRGEKPAADGVRSVLSEVLQGLSSSKEREFLLENAVEVTAKKPDSTLEDWLRNSFFVEHCKIFQGRPFIWQVWDGNPHGFSALVNYHKLAAPNGQGRKTLELLTFTYLGDWIDRQKLDQAEGVNGADDRLSAALDLQDQLKKILEGQSPCDIFVRWKPLHQQAIGWDPDINDGVRLNIRPFLSAQLRKGGKTGAGILRAKPGTIKWAKDRGKEPMRSKDDFPWFWGWDENSPALATDFGAPVPGAPPGGDSFDGNRWNDLHYTRAAKEAARARHRGEG